MTFISMSLSSYISHVAGAAVVGAVVGAGVALLYSKLNGTTVSEELRAQEIANPKLRLVKSIRQTEKL